MTEDEIEQLAQQIHIDRSSEAQKHHRQNTVPWDKLGETIRVSYRAEAMRQAAKAPE